LVFGGVVCLVYLEATNSCIQDALAPHVTRAREDARAAWKGLWKGVKLAGTRAVRIWFGWWPALAEGAFMVAAWGWAIKFRAFNPKVLVNKASFASPSLLTINVTFPFLSYCVACTLTSRSADGPLLRQDLGLEAPHHRTPPPSSNPATSSDSTKVSRSSLLFSVCRRCLPPGRYTETLVSTMPTP